MSDRTLFEAVTEADWQRLCKEFDTTKQRVAEDVALLEQWLTLQPHLPQNIRGDTLIRTMLIRCKMSLERTKEALDSFFTIKSNQPVYFSNRDPMSSEMQDIMDLVPIAPVPNLTKEGHQICLTGLRSTDSAKYSFDSNIKLIGMISEVQLTMYEALTIGNIMIFDCTNVTTAHLSKISLSQIKEVEVNMLNAFRVRVKAIHFVNTSSFINILLTMLKSVLKSKLVSRIHVHTSPESLHQHVDPELLPAELGGSYKTLTEIADDWRKELESHRDWFLEEEVLQRVDESKRPGGSTDTSAPFDMVGTFRTLTFD